MNSYQISHRMHSDNRLNSQANQENRTRLRRGSSNPRLQPEVPKNSKIPNLRNDAIQNVLSDVKLTRKDITNTLTEILNQRCSSVSLSTVRELLKKNTYGKEDNMKIAQLFYTIGMHHYNKEQYTAAEEFLKKAGYLGCSSSLYRLGILYMRDDLGENRGIPYSYRKAFDCFALAGNMGHSGAITNIGTLFFNTGKYEEALEYYRLGAYMGCTYAYKNIGKMYESGNGVHRDNVVALQYFQKCGSQRHIDRATRNILNETCFGAI